VQQDSHLTNLEQLLDRIGEAATEGSDVSLDAILDEVGRRSFGPLLLVAGLITVAPIIGDIPGVPTLMGVLVILIAAQVLFRHDHFWLPGWMLRRSISATKLHKALSWLRRPARFIDRFLRPRLTFLTQRAGMIVIAVVCMQIAIAMPFMEVVPFSANVAGFVLAVFGLALIACDGLLALIAFLVLVFSIGAGAYSLL
jgi:hypothetical protein